MQITEPRASRRRWTTPAAALVAASLLAAGLTPATAAVFAPNVAGYGVEAPRTAFYHHFYRGVPGQSRHRGTTDADLMAVTADPDAQEAAAAAYCAERFRSYDPASGTYLGYDGYEHACP